MKKIVKTILIIPGFLFMLQAFLYADGPLEKAGRGITNMVSGPIEFLREIATGSQENWYLPGMLLGTVKGLGKFVRRSFIGVYEIVTFPFPLPPDGYDKIIEDTEVWR